MVFVIYAMPGRSGRATSGLRPCPGPGMLRSRCSASPYPCPTAIRASRLRAA